MTLSPKKCGFWCDLSPKKCEIGLLSLCSKGLGGGLIFEELLLVNFFEKYIVSVVVYIIIWQLIIRKFHLDVIIII
jgi:hypothetical protein